MSNPPQTERLTPASSETLLTMLETLPGALFVVDDLDGLNSGIGVLTPEGIVLEINEVPLADVQIRREEVLGQPLAETWL